VSQPTQDLIERLGAAALDCRAAIREAHEATRDLKQARRELDTALADFRAKLLAGKQEAVDSITESFSEQTVTRLLVQIKEAHKSWSDELGFVTDCHDDIEAMRVLTQERTAQMQEAIDDAGVRLQKIITEARESIPAAAAAIAAGNHVAFISKSML
jgi:predicted  nucleic acid-binding Zn-ribbon protein